MCESLTITFLLDEACMCESGVSQADLIFMACVWVPTFAIVVSTEDDESVLDDGNHG